MCSVRSSGVCSLQECRPYKRTNEPPSLHSYVHTPKQTRMIQITSIQKHATLSLLFKYERIVFTYSPSFLYQLDSLQMASALDSQCILVLAISRKGDGWIWSFSLRTKLHPSQSHVTLQYDSRHLATSCMPQKLVQVCRFPFCGRGQTDKTKFAEDERVSGYVQRTEHEIMYRHSYMFKHRNPLNCAAPVSGYEEGYRNSTY